MKSKIILILSLCLITFQPFIIAEEIYRWVDEKGKIHYGNRPKNKDAKVFDKKNIQSVEMVKIKVKPVRTQPSNRNTRNYSRSSQSADKSQCTKLKNRMDSLESGMRSTAHGVKAFERYKSQIKSLTEQIRKNC